MLIYDVFLRLNNVMEIDGGCNVLKHSVIMRFVCHKKRQEVLGNILYFYLFIIFFIKINQAKFAG